MCWVEIRSCDDVQKRFLFLVNCCNQYDQLTYFKIIIVNNALRHKITTSTLRSFCFDRHALSLADREKIDLLITLLLTLFFFLCSYFVGRPESEPHMGSERILDLFSHIYALYAYTWERTSVRLV
jgi:cbb3-type cytochrome oxidase subunit 3